MVFDLVDSLAEDPSIAADFEAALADPQVPRAARERIRLPELTLEQREQEPAGSLGASAASFFRAHGLDREHLPRREVATDVEWLSAARGILAGALERGPALSALRNQLLHGRARPERPRKSRGSDRDHFWGTGTVPGA